MTATRYHSLVIDRQSCPDVLEITAGLRMELLWVCDIGTILVEGVQFHPGVCCRLQESSYYEISWNNCTAVRVLMDNEKATVDWLRWAGLLTAVGVLASEFKASAPPSSVSIQWLGHTFFLFTDARENQ